MQVGWRRNLIRLANIPASILAVEDGVETLAQLTGKLLRDELVDEDETLGGEAVLGRAFPHNWVEWLGHLAGGSAQLFKKAAPRFENFQAVGKTVSAECH